MSEILRQLGLNMFKTCLSQVASKFQTCCFQTYFQKRFRHGLHLACTKPTFRCMCFRHVSNIVTHILSFLNTFLILDTFQTRCAKHVLDTFSTLMAFRLHRAADSTKHVNILYQDVQEQVFCGRLFAWLF